MGESDLWAHLEYRVCREINGLKPAVAVPGVA
jgi:hypothetical protein